MDAIPGKLIRRASAQGNCASDAFATKGGLQLLTEQPFRIQPHGHNAQRGRRRPIDKL
jgi:hypothetical protein